MDFSTMTDAFRNTQNFGLDVNYIPRVPIHSKPIALSHRVGKALKYISLLGMVNFILFLLILN
ncbi:MAG: hypothetical protein K2X66_12735 [Cyanobacteria bacterium]|nr:hypothetical protein [Cyanobacteriota bacterium]